MGLLASQNDADCEWSAAVVLVLFTIMMRTQRSMRGKAEAIFGKKDSYNYDIERVKRCVIHYAAPDGKLYPFCTYNSVPTYREKIEKQFSISI